MPNVFDDVQLEWAGKKYTIPADQVLRCIAKVEEVITLGELANLGKKIPLARIATAYGVMLRHAGAALTDDEVYAGMFSDGAKDLVQRAVAATLTLQALMLPPAHLRETTPPKKGGGTSARPDSSSRSTNSRSAARG